MNKAIERANVLCYSCYTRDGANNIVTKAHFDRSWKSENVNINHESQRVELNCLDCDTSRYLSMGSASLNIATEAKNKFPLLVLTQVPGTGKNTGRNFNMLVGMTEDEFKEFSKEVRSIDLKEFS